MECRFCNTHTHTHRILHPVPERVAWLCVAPADSSFNEGILKVCGFGVLYSLSSYGYSTMLIVSYR